MLPVVFSVHSRRLVLLAVTAVGFVATAQRPRQVDDALLKSGSKTGEEWVSYGVNWSEQRYSPLHQIDASNVNRLGLAWTYDIPVAPGNFQAHQEATPLVFNGVLYSITPWSIVYAVDLRTGNELWRSDPEVNQQVWQSRICCGVVNRGIALYQGKVIAPAVDGRLRALDQATGKILWETRVSPENMPYTITMAPRVIKGGKVIIGVSGGEYAIRGFFAAFNVQTGKLAWKFYTVPGDPSKPFEQPELKEAAKTWSKDWWKIGGGAAVWNGMAYDADNDIVYVGTGQPGPWTDFTRGPGDNLYANCILAVKGSTGKLVWYYQEVPGDDWDFDSIADLMLVDLKIDGKNRKAIMHSPKDGFFYVLDRVTGELLSADPITKINWATGIDLKNGRPYVNPAARYGKDTVRVLPGPSGGHVWPPWSYSPMTGLVYIPGTAGGSYNYQADPNFVPQPTDVGPTGRGLMNMGTGRGAGGGQLGRGAGRGGNTDALPDSVAASHQASSARGSRSRPRSAHRNSRHNRSRWPHRKRALRLGPDRQEGTVAYRRGRRRPVHRRHARNRGQSRARLRERPPHDLPRRHRRKAHRNQSWHFPNGTTGQLHARRQAVHHCNRSARRRRRFRSRRFRWRRSGSRRWQRSGECACCSAPARQAVGLRAGRQDAAARQSIELSGVRIHPLPLVAAL